jgi:hypothetical protein
MMERNYEQFVEILMCQSDDLHRVGVSAYDYWNPEQPPTTLLFTDFGIEIARQFSTMSNNTKKAIFQHIEEGMTSNNTLLITAIATGLIEALISESEQHEGLWATIEPYLGMFSKRYAENWLSMI